jgi:hypothetical protein
MERQEHHVLQYLLDHAADKASRGKIEEYIRYRENKQNT